MRTNREEVEQRLLITWCRFHEERHTELKLIFHVPNGGLRSKSEAKRFKACGVKSGVPDLFLPVARNGSNGLFIELKTEKGKVSKEQKFWIDELNKQGYTAVVCYGWTDAVGVLCAYLGIRYDL